MSNRIITTLTVIGAVCNIAALVIEIRRAVHR